MIKIEKVTMYGFEEAIRGMRNAMNSWDRIDSQYCGEDGIWDSEDALEECPACPYFGDRCMKAKTPPYLVGPNDLGLMNSLSNGGPVHAKYRRFIVVYLDITAPLYWWKEFDTYRVGVTPNPGDIEMNSCSTMHKIHAKEFEMEDFSTEHLFDEDSFGVQVFTLDVFRQIIDALNVARDAYINTQDKRYWWQMIQLLPSSYNQKRTVMLNYEVLANIYEWRKNHKLDEWVEFCHWIESLPYSEIITGGKSDET